jgi:hypothetical protein
MSKRGPPQDKAVLPGCTPFREYSSQRQTVLIGAHLDQVQKPSITDANELIRRALKSKTYGASTPWKQFQKV